MISSPRCWRISSKPSMTLPTLVIIEQQLSIVAGDASSWGMSSVTMAPLSAEKSMVFGTERNARLALSSIVP